MQRAPRAESRTGENKKRIRSAPHVSFEQFQRYYCSLGMKSMRYVFQLLFLFIFSTSVLSAQQEKEFLAAVNFLKANQELVPKYSFPTNESGRNILILEVPFSNSNFISARLADAVKGKVVEKIERIYTTFKVSSDFDQQKLNQQRLKNLFSLLPNAFSNPMTEWKLIGQTGAQSVEAGNKYFHGFVITWRPDASPSWVKNELLTLDSIFLKTIPNEGSSSGGLKLDSLRSDLRVLTYADGSKVVFNRNISEDSLWQYLKPDKKDFSVVTAMWIDTGRTSLMVIEKNFNGVKIKRIWKLEDHFSDTPITSENNVYLHNPDSVVTTVMRRNSWDHIVLVADVTGSMSPYSAQVLAWVPIGLAGGKCAGFVFYNDGDGKSTNQKDVGKTGGIYAVQTQRQDSVFMTMKKAMNAGDGGDLEENPVEAMIYSLNHFPITTEIILIADNFSAPRDLALYAKVNRPVHIVLCGARGTVNPDYLFLARQSHGTIHTVHDDILHLDEMKEGEVVVIEGKHYLLHDEHFICNETFSRY